MLQPDYAAIEGSVDAGDAKLSVAAATVKEKMRDIRALARRYRAKLIIKELVRATRSKPGHPGRTSMHHYRGQNVTSEFHVIQRLELRVPIRANIDNLISKLSSHGMQLGKQLNFYRSRNSKVVVFFRFSDLEAQLESLRGRCISNAIEDWCAKEFSESERQDCTSALVAMKARFKTQSFYLKVGPHIRSNGHPGYSSLRYPWRIEQLEALELIGNGKVPVIGNIRMRSPRQY